MTGLLLWAGWPTSPLVFFLFVAFVPFLSLLNQIEKDDKIKRKGTSVFGYSYLMFLTWNITTTWWVWNSTVGGTIMAIVANSLLMTLPVLLHFHIRKRKTHFLKGISFIATWVIFEHLHLNWDLSWPWITIGNGLSLYPSMIQWYEYTGALGGTIWVLLVNYLIYLLINTNFKSVKSFLPVIGAVLLPLAASWLIYLSEVSKTIPPNKEVTEAVIVQPNVDPYNEKFHRDANFIPYHEQLYRLIRLSEEQMTKETKWVIWPETAIQGPHAFNENTLENNRAIQRLRMFLQEHPGVQIVGGIDTWGQVDPKDEYVSNPRYRKDIGYYKGYNTAIYLTTNELELYHKSKLVPGVEILPFPTILQPVQDLINFNGAGNYGKSKESIIFGKDVKTAPIICYESIYGEHVSEFVKKGANFISVITNDGWWGNTQGHKHHNIYARMRAIENRRPVVRSANTGISSYINILGEEEIRTKWWEQDSFNVKFPVYSELTFYTKFGDWIIYLAYFMLIGGFVFSRRLGN